MLVRERNGMWQLVRQPDHGDLSGQFARAWGGDAIEPLRHGESLALAAMRHDDGWAVYDRRPEWDPENMRPRNFLDVPIRSHLAFYQTCIWVVSEEDPYAGLLVSMHAAGIYNGRYGTDPSLADPSLALSRAGEVKADIDAFVAAQEASHPERVAALDVSEDEGWVNYKLLQIYDRLSLAFCLREWESADAEPFAIAPIPTDYAGAETNLRLEPLGPWRVRLDPYPFSESPTGFTVARKLILEAPYKGNKEFRETYFATRTELVDITVER